MQSWSCDWEIKEYWDKVVASQELSEVYRKEFQKDLSRFNVFFPHTVVDIGGGAFGGVFHFLDIGRRKILLDPCATEFKKRYSLIPENVELIDAYCNKMPLGDCSVDVVFCIETLDHCNIIEDYVESANEILRILRKGGKLYFMLPLRKTQIDGHFISLETMTLDDIIKPFRGLKNECNIIDNHLYLTGEKRE
jgi:ubiquinone/menaquinone biosynthesis C-methylase UbiE